MNKKTLIVFFIVLLNQRMLAQTPGYMGKRFVIGVGNSIAPNFKLLYFLDNPNTPYLGPVITSSFNLEYVASSRRMFCFSFRYMSRNIENRYDYNFYGYGKVKFEKFHLLNYSIGIKKFMKNRIAPIGSYIRWECSYINGWMDYKPYAERNNADYSLIQKDGGKIKFYGSGGAFSFGRQRVFIDKLVVDFGVRSTLIVVVGTPSNQYEKQLAGNASDVSIFSLTNFSIAIGFLAF